MASAIWNITLRQDEDFIPPLITLQNSAGVAIDLTGYTLYIMGKASAVFDNWKNMYYVSAQTPFPTTLTGPFTPDFYGPCIHLRAK